MSRARPELGPVKAWIEPDRWAFLRAFPLQTLLLVAVVAASVGLAFQVHPLFWLLSFVALFRHAAAEASLRELWREGMLHPARVVRRGLLATLVRLEGEGGVQDAVVVSPLPRRWRKKAPPWGGERAGVVIAGEPPRLRPLSADFASGDVERGRRTTERIPERHWQALDAALAQLGDVREGVHPVQLGQDPWYGTLSEVESEGSLPESASHVDAQIWCAGLPCVEEPEMVPRERERVVQRRMLARLRAVALGLVGFGVPLGFLAAVALHELDGRMPAPWLPALGSATFLVAPLFILFAIGALSRARAYTRDLAEGRVLRFVGTLSSFDSLALDADLALLTRKGLLAPEPGLEQDMVVLPHSKEVLYANGVWSRAGLAVQAERVAPPPDDAIKLPLPEEVQAQGVSAVSVARRRFTPLELDELARHAARLRKPGQLFWLVTGFAALALVSWAGQGWTVPPEPVGIPVALSAWAFAFANVLRRMRLATRLGEDVELGWVLTVDHERADKGDVELPSQGVETLLHARLDWTVNRRPATWRRHGPGVS